MDPRVPHDSRLASMMFISAGLRNIYKSGEHHLSFIHSHNIPALSQTLHMSSDAGIGHSITEQQQDGPVHPELSPQIVDALNSLVDHVSSAASAFACGSIISDNQLNMKDVTLFFKDADK